MSEPKKFYSVPCPFCGAEVGRHCFQLSQFRRLGRKKWYPPHNARKAAWAKNEPSSDDFINNATV